MYCCVQRTLVANSKPTFQFLCHRLHMHSLVVLTSKAFRNVWVFCNCRAWSVGLCSELSVAVECCTLSHLAKLLLQHSTNFYTRQVQECRPILRWQGRLRYIQSVSAGHDLAVTEGWIVFSWYYVIANYVISGCNTYILYGTQWDVTKVTENYITSRVILSKVGCVLFVWMSLYILTSLFCSLKDAYPLQCHPPLGSLMLHCGAKEEKEN